MGNPIARLGDQMTHGAKIISGSTDKLSDGKPTVTIGSTVYCPEHGTNSIINVSTTTVQTDGKLTATVNARAACGAIVISGSQTISVG
jgi:uncharacterized Zn-binding protein involved in type VI secretion